jgi:DNA gyrase subunit A
MVVGMTATDAEREQVLALCERGYGKRTPLSEFRVQHRGGKGIILIDCSERNGPVVGVALVKSGDELMLITDRGQTIRTTVDDIRETGRNAQGVRVMNVEDDERVVAVEAIGDRTIPEDPDAADADVESADVAGAEPDSDDTIDERVAALPPSLLPEPHGSKPPGAGTPDEDTPDRELPDKEPPEDTEPEA